MKTSKSDADYTPRASMPSQRCALCRHFVAPAACRKVEGQIAAAGWCRFWESSHSASQRRK